MDPINVLMITFTDAAAREMNTRLKDEFRKLSEKDEFKVVAKKWVDTAQARTFDSLCHSIVMDSTDSVGEFFGFEGAGLSRSAILYTNDALNGEYFSRFLDGFLLTHDGEYLDIAPIAAQNPEDVRRLLDKMMAYGIIPMRDGSWFGFGWRDAVNGNRSRMVAALEEVNRINGNKQSVACGGMKSYLKDLTLPSEPIIQSKDLAKESVDQAIDQDRSEMIDFIHDVYLEFIHQSILDNRLTFGLVEIFAFTLLYSGKTKEHKWYSHLMIDEFQDTNPLQMMISLMLLSEPNLCVVGDWKQGIYGFRYSTVENMLLFEKKVHEFHDFLNGDDCRHVAFDIPDDITRIALKKNRRSSQEIIDTAYEAMYIPGSDKEDMRGYPFLFHEDDSEEDRKAVLKDPELLAKKKADFSIVQNRDDIGPDDSHVRFVRSESKGEEASDVVKAVKDYICNDYRVIEDKTPRHVGPGDIAVFCRSNAACRVVMDALKEESIPVHLVGDVDIMNTREGKLALAWLRYVSNENDRSGFIPIMMDLGYTFVEMRTIKKGSDVPQFIRDQRSLLDARKKRITEMMATIFDFYDDLDSDIVQAIITAVSQAHEGSMISIASIVSMMEYDIRNGTTYEIENTVDTDAVTVMTMHKSKGLEYPVVILAYVDLYVIPSYRSDDSVFFFNEVFGLRCRKEIGDYGGYKAVCDSWRTKLTMLAMPTCYDEDRRLLFVALSRAKQYETIICGKSKNVSPFFDGLLSATGKGVESIPDSDFDASRFNTGLSSKPEIIVPESRFVSMSVHEILRLESDVGVDGEGVEYGNMVHSWQR